MEPDQLEFERDGVLVVRGAFDASGMPDALWDGLAKYGFMRDDPTTWDVRRMAPEGYFPLPAKFGKSGRFVSIATDSVAEAITSVFGEEWHQRGPWGQPLITFPTPPPWTLPSGYHVDFPPRATEAMPALRMFAYLSSVDAQGGGTLVVVGSHKLSVAVEGQKSREIRARLAARSEWFRDLWRPVPGQDRVEPFMIQGAIVDGVQVRVVELTGQPGDLVLWHPALIHGGSPNCNDHPRFMLTHTAFRGPATDPGAN